jgi:hypothetical protein
MGSTEATMASLLLAEKSSPACREPNHRSLCETALAGKERLDCPLVFGCAM